MIKTDQTLDSINKYARSAPKFDFIHPAESLLFSQNLKPGMQVLDLGCGTGRVTRELVRLGMAVHACDLDQEALKFVQCPTVHLQVADARDLTYPDKSFDAVIFAYNGIDYMNPESDRLKTLNEIDRVLKPGGWFLFSSHNPIGGALSPRGLKSIAGWGWRVKCLMSGGFLQRYGVDRNGMTLWHGTPRQVIKQVESISMLRFQLCLDKTARIKNNFMLTLFSPWPHYLFRKSQE